MPILLTSYRDAYTMHPRDCDYDRYLCSLFVGRAHRPALWWTIAFAHEVMRIPARVSEEMVGLVRLKWWQEELGKLKEPQEIAAPLPLLQQARPLFKVHPALKDAAIALCDAVAEHGFAAQEKEAVIAMMRAYVRLLSVAAQEEEAQPHYESLAVIAAMMAYRRTVTLSSLEHQQITDAICTLWQEQPCPSSPYARHLWLLTRRAVRAMQKNDTPPSFLIKTLQLLWDSFTFSLQKPCYNKTH